MADLARSAVTLNKYWRDGHNNQFVCKDVTVLLANQGDATDKITASALGLTRILNSSPAVESGDNSVYLTAPSYDRSYLTFVDAALAVVTADGTFRFTVTGEV